MVYWISLFLLWCFGSTTHGFPSPFSLSATSLSKPLSYLGLGLLFMSNDGDNQEDDDDDVVAELNAHWAATATSVASGDFISYQSLYARNAVVVDTVSEPYTTKPIDQALEAWKAGFDATAAGNQTVTLEFRFSQRVHSATTAHETGIFCYSSRKKNHNDVDVVYVHFESLLVKDPTNGWGFVMEYQRHVATKEEWDALPPL